MGNIVSSMAFYCPPSSYDKNILYLEFVTREKMIYSSLIEYKIPIRYYIKDKKLSTMIICHGKRLGANLPYK